MENLKSHSHTMDLFEMYEKEFKVLCSDHNALQLENADIKLHYKNKLTAERKKTTALIQEIDELKKKLQRANFTSAGGVKVVSSSAAEAPAPNLDVDQSAENEMLAAELEMEKKESEALSQDIAELNLQLQTERDLRAKAEARASEAVEIADQLMWELKEMHNSSQTPSPTAQTLDAELKAKVEDLQVEVQELNQTLQKEKELRVQAEAEKVEAIKTAEAVKRCSDNALQSLRTLEKTLEDAGDRYLAEKKKNDDLQQEIAELRQKQSDHRDQHETDSLREFETLEDLCQELLEVKRVSENQSTERQSLTTRLETEEKKQKSLCHDILWLIQVLEKEMEARVRAETDKQETVEVGEALCQQPPEH